MTEKLKDYLIDIKLESGKTAKGIYKYTLDRLIDSLKEEIKNSTLYPTTQKKIITMINKIFDDGKKDFSNYRINKKEK